MRLLGCVALALIPLFNVCQLIKEIFLGDFSLVPLAVGDASPEEISEVLEAL